jgi:hypothetical protein
MVLYYGLFALETANSILQQESLSRKSRISSSSNSWIYTEDLKKRYHDYHYIFIPVNEKPAYYYYNSITMMPRKSPDENSWMYSRSLREHLFNSTSICYMTNPRFMHDESTSKSRSNEYENSSILLVKPK